MAVRRTLELQSSLLEKLQIVAPFLGFLGGFTNGGVFEQQLVAMHLYPLGTFDLNVRCRDSPLPGLLKWFLNRTWKKMTDHKELVEASEDQTWVIVPDVVKKEWNDVVKSSQELERAFQEEMEEDGWLIFPELALEKKYEGIVELYGEKSRPSGALNKRDNIFSAYSSEVNDLVLVVRNLEEGLEGGTSEQLDEIEQGATLIFSTQKDMDNFTEEQEKLQKDLEVRKAKLMRQRYEEDEKLEKEFDEELARLIKKYQAAKQVSVRARAPDMSPGEESQEDSSSRARSELR